MAAPSLTGVWKYSPDQPRDEAGRWSAGGGATTFGDNTVSRSWEGFPFRTATGEQAASFDLAPRRTPEGDFVLYHGTDAQAAESIMRSRTFLPDDIGHVGFGTDPIKVGVFGYMKAPREPENRAFIEAVLDQHWLGQHTWATREGNHESLFLLGAKRGGKLTIPPEAIKGMRLISRDEAWELRKDWDPEKHPRDDKGRFIAVDGGWGGEQWRSEYGPFVGHLTEGATARQGDFVPRPADPSEFALVPGIHEMGVTPSEGINYGRIEGTHVVDRVVQPDLFPGVERVPRVMGMAPQEIAERAFWEERHPMPGEAPSDAGEGHWSLEAVGEGGYSWRWYEAEPEVNSQDDYHARRAERYLEAESMAPEDLFAAAKESFPNGGPLRDTGWILPDGTRLDFGRAKGFGGGHWVAHGEVGAIMPDVGPSIDAIDIFRQAGAIRVDTGHPGDKAEGAMVIDLDKEPTQAQWDTLEEFRAIPGIKYAYAGRGEFNEDHRIEIDNPNWKEEVRRAIGYGDNPDVLEQRREAEPENPLAQRVEAPSAERMAAEAAHEAEQAAAMGMTPSAYREYEAVQNQAVREGWSEEREDAALEAIRQRGRGVVKAEWRKGYPEYNPDQARDESGRWAGGNEPDFYGWNRAESARWAGAGVPEMTARSADFVPHERPAPSIAVGPTGPYARTPYGYTDSGSTIIDPDVRVGAVQPDLFDSRTQAEYFGQRLVQPDLFPNDPLVERRGQLQPDERPDSAVGPGHWSLNPDKNSWRWIEESGPPSWATGPGHWTSQYVSEGTRTREWVSDPTPEEEESPYRSGGSPGGLTDVPAEEALQSAVDIFGTTDNPHQAAFILPNGDMLDFSGTGKFSHVTPWGDRPGLEADGRYVIHQQIGQVYGQDWHDIYRAGGHDDEAVDKFVEETKSIRFTNGWQGYKDVVGVTAEHPLTSAQMDRIELAFDEGADVLHYSGPGTERHLYDESYSRDGNWRAEIAHEDADLEPEVVGQDEGADWQHQRTEGPRGEELAAEAARAAEAGMTVSAWRALALQSDEMSNEERRAIAADIARAERVSAAALRSQGVLKAEWDPEKHPRGEHGWFAEVEGGGLAGGADAERVADELGKRFGETTDPYRANWLLPNGHMVSAHWFAGERQPHPAQANEVLAALGLKPAPGRYAEERVMEYGVMRFLMTAEENHLYVNFHAEPTAAQERKLEALVRDAKPLVTLDFRLPDGTRGGVSEDRPRSWATAYDRALRRARGAQYETFKNWEDQPRVPAGSPEGGEWTSTGEAGGAGEVRTGPLARLGQRVADMSVEERWAWFGTQNRMALANPTVTIPHAMNGVRAELSSKDPQGRIREAVTKGLVMPDAERPMLDRLDALTRDLTHAGAPPSAIAGLRDLLTDAYLAQEHEALGRSLGDHGVRHLAQDVEDARAILDALPGHVGSDPRVGAMLEIAGAFHDTGYLTPPGQLFMDQGHPDWAAAYYRDAVAPLAAEALGANAAARIEEMIATHESTAIDWRRGEALSSAFRVADNLALFHQEKLPALVRYIPATRAVLVGLANGSLNVSEARALLADHVSQRAGLPPGVREKLYAAASETTTLLPKFTLGMYGGRTTGFEWTGDHLRVNILRLPPDPVNRVGNLHVNQFYKLAKTYGLDEEAARLKSNVLHFRRAGRELLEINIKGEAVWKRLQFTLASLNPALVAEWVRKYSPDQPRDEQGRWTSGGGDGGTVTIFGARVMTPTYQPEPPKVEELPDAMRFRPGQQLSGDDIAAYERAIAPMGTERALLIDAQGQCVVEKSGTKDRVTFRPEELKATAILTHNHPGGANMSPGDLRASIEAGIGEVRVTSRWADGREVRYRLAGLENYDPHTPRTIASDHIVTEYAIETSLLMDTYHPLDQQGWTVETARAALPWPSAIEAEVDRAVKQYHEDDRAGREPVIFGEPVESEAGAAHAARSMVVWREHCHHALKNLAAQHGMTYERTIT